MARRRKKSKLKNKAEVIVSNPTDKESSFTAPVDSQMLKDVGVGSAEMQVWENQNASMQEKAYSFDEVTTDADYEFEDDFEFQDDNSERIDRLT